MSLSLHGINERKAEFITMNENDYNHVNAYQQEKVVLSNGVKQRCMIVSITNKTRISFS